MIFIYCHRNKINNKVYIGKTVDPTKRWSGNGCKYKSCIKFYNAIQKYGWDNFEHIILEKVSSNEEADIQEQYWIKYFDSIKNGYNLTQGGTGGDCIHNLSEEKQNELKEFHRKETLSRGTDWHEKLSEGQRKAWKEGRRIKSLNGSDSKPVKCIETNIIYSSCAEAMEAMNKPRKNSSCISRVANGERASYNNYHWEWVK